MCCGFPHRVKRLRDQQAKILHLYIFLRVSTINTIISMDQIYYNLQYYVEKKRVLRVRQEKLDNYEKKTENSSGDFWNEVYKIITTRNTSSPCMNTATGSEDIIIILMSKSEERY